MPFHTSRTNNLCLLITLFTVLCIFGNYSGFNINFDKGENFSLENPNEKSRLPLSSAPMTNVCITEIYADGTYEWFELYNPTDALVSLDGWTLEDENFDLEWAFATDDVLQPYQVMTFGDPASVPTPNKTYEAIGLTDTGDALILVDNLGQYRDVVIYGDITGEPAQILNNTGYWNSNSGCTAPDGIGLSLERINYTDDNNHPNDYQMDSTMTPGWIPYTATANINSTLQISEVMYGGNGIEWVEISNYGYLTTNLSGCLLHSYINGNKTGFQDTDTIGPLQKLIIGDHPSADIIRNISLNDAGDVLLFKEPGGFTLDAVVWGSGANNFSYGAQYGWETQTNATGGLSQGSSIFRYSLSKTLLSDTNRSDDWYPTTEPTMGSVYEVKVNDVYMSEIAPDEFPTTDEFIEIYNNLTFPITLDGMEIWDYGTGAGLEVPFSGNISVPAKEFIVASPNPIYDYYVSDAELTLTTQENLVLFRDSTKSYVLDVMMAEPDQVDWDWTDPANGWNGPNNVSTTGVADGVSIQRINITSNQLIDTNSSSDWEVKAITPGYLAPYVPPAPAGNVSSVLITEVMIDPYDEGQGEYIELYNTLDIALDIGNWTIWYNNFASKQITLPIGTIIPAKSYLAIVDDDAYAATEYEFSGLNHTESLSLGNSDPRDVCLVDSYLTIIDRFAWIGTSTQTFVDTIGDGSWEGNGVYSGSEGKSIARLYDPNNNDAYLDTNTSADWRYNVFPTLGDHTNKTYFLSTPIEGIANVTAFSSPDNSYDAMKDLIRSAESTIDVCVYQFTSYHLLQEFIAAMDKGVKVRLILEDIYPLYDSPYLADTTHDPENYEVVYVATQIHNHANGTVRWEGYTGDSKYTHAKYIIIDNETVVITTENFKYTGIPKDNSAGNRGVGIAIQNVQLANKYLTVFNFDWSISEDFNPSLLVPGEKNDEVLKGDYKSIGPYETFTNENVKLQTAVGPDETIDVVVGLIESANTSIYVEMFYIYPTWTGWPGGENNNPFLQALINASMRGVDVKVILDSTYYSIEGDNNNDEAAQILTSHGVEVKYSINSEGIEKFHIKSLIVDEKAVMISSLNWNENSATNNREIGIIIISSIVAVYYVNIFEYDWEDLSQKDIPEDEEEEDLGLPKTYTWLAWLPMLTIGYIGLLFVGYIVRRSKESAQLHKRIKEDKLEAEKAVEEEEIESIQIDINWVRQRVGEMYGEVVKVFHLDYTGLPLDDQIPSDFVLNYIGNNHDLIKVGMLATPLPRLTILKYNPENYIAIEGTLQLQLRITDKALQAQVDELREELNKKEGQIANYVDDIEDLKEKLNKFESTIPSEEWAEIKAGKESKFSKDLKEKEDMIKSLSKMMNDLRQERTELKGKIDKIAAGTVSPLSDLVNELQAKISKQKLMIKQLKKEKEDRNTT